MPVQMDNVNALHSNVRGSSSRHFAGTAKQLAPFRVSEAFGVSSHDAILARPTMLWPLRPEVHDTKLVAVIDHGPKTLAWRGSSVIVDEDNLVALNIVAAVARGERSPRHQLREEGKRRGQEHDETLRRRRVPAGHP